MDPNSLRGALASNRVLHRGLFSDLLLFITDRRPQNTAIEMNASSASATPLLPEFRAAAPAHKGRSLDSIQAFRGLAALAVVIHHAFDAVAAHFGGKPVFSRFNTSVGSAGVDLFFIISGFIMVYTTHKKPITGAEFLRHRIVRIFPLYWICVAFAYALQVSPWVQNGADILANPGAYLKSLILYPSTFDWGIGLFMRTRPLGQGWTLVFEMVFYVVFAVCLYMTKARRTVAVAVCILGLYGLGQLLPAGNAWTLVLGDGIILEFILGLCLAHLYIAQNFSLSRSGGRVALLVGVAGLLGFALFPIYAQSWPRLFTLGFPCLLIASAFLLEKSQIRNWPQALLKLGDASYSIYLIHASIFMMLQIGYDRIAILRSLHWGIYTVLLISSALIGGFCLYYLAEAPIARWFKRRLSIKAA